MVSMETSIGSECCSNVEKSETQEATVERRSQELVIDVDGNGDHGDGEGDHVGISSSCANEEAKMCRVCHLGSECLEQSGDLIQLGCKCKGDLGTAHQRCAEIWFALKDSRYCEICGAIATNVALDGENRYVVKWDVESITSPYPAARIRMMEQGYHQPVCGCVGAIVFLALTVYWFFHTKPHFP